MGNDEIFSSMFTWLLVIALQSLPDRVVAASVVGVLQTAGRSSKLVSFHTELGPVTTTARLHGGLETDPPTHLIL